MLPSFVHLSTAAITLLNLSLLVSFMTIGSEQCPVACDIYKMALIHPTTNHLFELHSW